MTIENLVDIQGPLADTFKQLDPNTIQHAYEIMNARRSDQSLRNILLWTADSDLYKVEKQPVFYFGNRDTNLVFRNIDEATQQLIKSIGYIPGKQAIDEVVASVKSGSTLRIRLSDLKLKDYDNEFDNEFSYFEIDTKEYNELNKVQRAFAERVYGQGTDFKQNMKMLNDAGIKTARIRVLNQKYVQDKAKENGAIVRACGLDIFGGVSRFGAVDRIIGFGDVMLRGVRRVIAAGDAPQNKV